MLNENWQKGIICLQIPKIARFLALELPELAKTLKKCCAKLCKMPKFKEQEKQICGQKSRAKVNVDFYTQKLLITCRKLLLESSSK